jgi:hypothetical protein
VFLKKKRVKSEDYFSLGVSNLVLLLVGGASSLSFIYTSTRQYGAEQSRGEESSASLAAGGRCREKELS